MKKQILPLALIVLSACNSEYNKQMDLAKKDKCDMLAKMEQFKTDTTNLNLKEEIFSLERMLDTRAELSGNVSQFNEEIKTHKCN